MSYDDKCSYCGQDYSAEADKRAGMDTALELVGMLMKAKRETEYWKGLAEHRDKWIVELREDLELAHKTIDELKGEKP